MIVIKTSDKGGNVVIMDHLQYREMCMSILSDKKAFNPLERDPTDIYKLELFDILKRA